MHTQSGLKGDVCCCLFACLFWKREYESVRENCSEQNRSLVSVILVENKACSCVCVVYCARVFWRESLFSL